MLTIDSKVTKVNKETLKECKNEVKISFPWKDQDTQATNCYLTNRFHFAVRLYSDNAQMTSKRGENKEVRYEPQASSVTDVLTTF